MADQRIWWVDLYAEGSCVYQLDRKGEIVSIEAWARNTLDASAAFKTLCERNPDTSYSQRRKSHVENERIVKR